MHKLASCVTNSALLSTIIIMASSRQSCQQSILLPARAWSQDQEVKECAIMCVASIVAVLGDKINKEVRLALGQIAL